MDLLLFVSENNLLIDDSDVFRKNIMEIQSRLNISCRLIKLKKDFSLLSDSEDTVYVVRIHKELSKGELFYLSVEWKETKRDLYWTKDDVGYNYSIIKYQRNATNLNSVSVIISTFNQPKWLEKTLWGYSRQSFSDFEVIIADDGSSKETFLTLQRLSATLPFSIKHVWHEDEGFKKCDILNKAILSAQAEYLLFSDGDCIPRNDFIEAHVLNRAEGYFLSGGYHKLGRNLSELIDKEDIESGRCFDVKWLKGHGMAISFKNNKLTAKGFVRFMLNTFTPTKATWNGHNASAWLKDILAVNGFDERMKYGGEDREFGERLVNYGIRGKQIRYTAVCIHLDHSRGYVTQDALDYNIKLRKSTRLSKNTTTLYGAIKS